MRRVARSVLSASGRPIRRLRRMCRKLPPRLLRWPRSGRPRSRRGAGARIPVSFSRLNTVPQQTAAAVTAAPQATPSIVGRPNYWDEDTRGELDELEGGPGGVDL